MYLSDPIDRGKSIYCLKNKETSILCNIKNIYMLLLFTIMSFITINLTLLHKKPTAIYKVSEYLIRKEKPITIISIPLINYFLKSQNLDAQYINIENNLKEISIDSTINNKIFIIGNYSEKINGLYTELDTTFYHNPYVNRMWSGINIYSNQGL